MLLYDGAHVADLLLEHKDLGAAVLGLGLDGIRLFDVDLKSLLELGLQLRDLLQFGRVYFRLCLDLHEPVDTVPERVDLLPEQLLLLEGMHRVDPSLFHLLLY